MKNPIISFPLLAINGLWLGLIASLIISPWILCVVYGGFLGSAIFLLCAFLIMFGLYRLDVGQVSLLVLIVIAAILTAFFANMIESDVMMGQFAFMSERCATLEPSEKNDRFVLFVLSFMYAGIFGVLCGLKRVFFRDES